MFTRMTLRKKIAVLITTSVLIVAVAAWIMMYRTERSKLIDDNRERAVDLKAYQISSSCGAKYTLKGVLLL